jgi:hypothetical protein
MIYPKCLYKTKEETKVVQNESEHEKAADAGWLDIWTDKKPYDFAAKKAADLVKEKEAKAKANAEIKELAKQVEKEEAEAKAAEAKAEKERKEAEEAKKALAEKEGKNGNRKNTPSGGSKTS